MAMLGSRMLEATKRVGETVEAIEMRQSGENSVLQTLAISVSDSLSQVLRWVYWWNSTEATPEAVSEDTVLLSLNTDFAPKGMTAMELQATVQAWQAGAISMATMFDVFRKGEVLPAGRSDEEEVSLIATMQNSKLKIQNAEQIGRENQRGVLINTAFSPSAAMMKVEG
jgi:hypothetical protein